MPKLHDFLRQKTVDIDTIKEIVKIWMPSKFKHP